MTTRVRGRPKGCVKTGGRVAGKSLDKGQRQLVSAELAGSIMTTFEGLGGTEAMLAWAVKNQTVFYTQILSRLYPAPQRDDDGIQVNTQVNVSTMTDREAAVRVAFALSKAVYDNAEPVTPQPACDWQPRVAAPLVHPEPVEDPAKTLWIEEIALSPEQRRNAALIRETKEVSISTYRGGPGEQSGPGPVSRPAGRKPTISEIRRRQLLS